MLKLKFNVFNDIINLYKFTFSHDARTMNISYLYPQRAI